MAIDIITQEFESTDDVQTRLKRHGYAVLHSAGEERARQIAGELGSVVGTTEVAVDEHTANMVTGSQELGLHTDHGAVDYIMWYCRAQCDAGGHSRLVDTKPVLEAMSDEQRRELESVFLTEHRIFEDDPVKRPLLRREGGDARVYYSFWLLDDDLNEEQAKAVDTFRHGVESADEIRFRLQPGDVLIVDNRRVLHGRTAIEGESQRLLERFWICDETTTAQTKGEGKFVLPPAIPITRIDELVARGVDPVVAAIDLSMVKMKMRDADEGEGWTPAECEEAELEYKRYLTLNQRYEDRAIVPTKQIDTMWHYHILDTRAYHRDCENVFGEYFHHFPYFGMRGDEDEENLKASFFETVELYEAEFGEPMLRNEAATSCWHDCKGRCWHACKSG